MPQPSYTEVHVDAVLTNMSVAYIQSHDAFVSSRAFPIVPVDKASDKYFVWTKNDWFRDEARPRGDSMESVGTGMNLSTATYSCDVWAIHKDVGHLTRANADIDIGRAATELVTQRMLLRKEIQWVTDYFTTSVWGTDVTPGALWSNYATSDPITDIETGRTTILSTTGMKPNTLVLGYQVYTQLRHHPDIIDRIKYTTSAVVSEQLLAQMFDVERVLVASAIKATNVEGETSAYSFVFGKHALLCYSAPNPSPLTPSAGYSFGWRGVSQGLGEVVGVSQFYIPELKTDRYEGEIAFDHKLVASDLGYFFSSVVA